MQYKLPGTYEVTLVIMENMEHEQAILCNQENLPLVGLGNQRRPKTFDLSCLQDVLE